MENTLENKAKFFAQYWGQRVMAVTVNEDNTRHKIGNSHMGKYHVECCHLELNPLSSITDEDLFYLPLDYSYPETKILSVGEIVFSEKSKSLLIELSIKYIINGNKCGSIYYQELKQPQIDYLRMRGYAVPWIELTIEELINYGWIKVFRNKIIENKN